MKYHFVFSILLLIGLLFALPTSQVENNESTQNDQTTSCDSDLPYMSVGDLYLTEDNFTKVIMSSGPTLVVITGKDCVDCCQYEKLYKKIRDEILTNKTLLHGKDVQIARVKFEDVPVIQDRVKKLPEFFFYYKEMGYSFEHDYNATSIGLTLSKVIQPVKLLKEYSDFKEFLDEEISFDHNGQKVVAIKTIAIYSKKDDLQYETKEFKKTASHFSVYHDLQFALVTKESVIDQIHQERRSSWFPPYMRSTIILINRKGEERKIDPTFPSSEHLQDEILLKGKAIVEPLSIETQRLYRKYKWPLLVSFLDLEDTKTLQPHLDILTEVGKKFDGHMAVAYLNQSIHANKRDSVGIFHQKTPALSIIPSNDRTAYPYPENLPITTENLIKFVKNFFEGKLTPYKLPDVEEGSVQTPPEPVQKQYQNIDL